MNIHTIYLYIYIYIRSGRGMTEEEAALEDSCTGSRPAGTEVTAFRAFLN